MKLFCPITTLKFVGTISLGLLTGVSYSLTTTTLPSLALLPSASSAKQTLNHIQTKATQQILTLASISSLSLITAYSLASPRGKHPYLLWTALASFLGGQGVEYYYNGLDRFYKLGGKKNKNNGNDNTTSHEERSISMKESGYVEVVTITTENSSSSSSSSSSSDVNGEKVEMEMTQERKTQMVRSVLAGCGFLMGVIGIWGDGV